MSETNGKKIDELVSDYLQLRDAKEDLKRKFSNDTEEIDDAMDKIETEFLRQLQESGLETVGTRLGTVYQTTKKFAKVEDWNVLVDYVKQNDAYDLLTKNVSKDAVIQRMAETGGEVIPGVSIFTKNAVGVRRK